MKAKNAMYAAVGAPIVAARALNARLETLREELESRGEGLGDRAQKLLDEWSQEGRQAVGKVTDGKVVDEFAAKVDFDQAKEQVGKLRDQLEDMLATWRTSFRPETGDQVPARPDPIATAEQARTQKAAGEVVAVEETSDLTPTGEQPVIEPTPADETAGSDGAEEESGQDDIEQA